MRKLFAAAVSAAFLAAAAATPGGAQTAQPEKPRATTTAKPATKRAVSPGQAAMRERQKKCGAEWREAKAAGKVEKGMTWPKYWSACNKRLKGQA